MARKESGGKCFTFLWKLENISYCLQKKGERIESPPFMVDEIEKTKWCLKIYPRGDKVENSVAYYLRREADSEGADKVEIKYELAFIANDGSVLTSYNATNDVFLKSGGFGYGAFAKRECVFISRRSEFLPRDTLIARCRIWKSVGQMTEDIRCAAFTRVGVEKRFLAWNVKNFSTLESDKKCTYRIKSIQNSKPLMSVDLSLSVGLNTEDMRFELCPLDATIKFCTLRLFLVDAAGNKVACNQEEMWFDGPGSCKQLTFTFTKKKLMEEKSMYLPNDTLSLLLEWAFSKGVVSEEIEEVLCGCTYLESKVAGNCKINDDKMSLSNALIDNVKSLYDEHFLCDVKLKTNTSVFPAHKFTLSASSSVFKAMFSNDMKEKICDCVNIEDLNDDTVGRMLLFIYTARVECLTWEAASHLYVAADKYAILSLKNICSSFLKINLSPTNACEVLLMSDFHADGDLKSTVQDYIIKNGKQIIKSDEWNVLLETNAKLAAETLAVLFK